MESRVGQAQRGPTTHFRGFWWGYAALDPPYKSEKCNHLVMLSIFALQIFSVRASKRFTRADRYFRSSLLIR